MKSALLVFLGLLSAPIASVQGQLAVNQMEVFMTPIAKGAVEPSAIFTVTNESDKPVQGVLTMEDWDRAANGDNHFYKFGTAPNSCKGILEAFPLSVQVAAHSAQQIRLRLNGTDKMTAACWSVIFIQSEAPAAVNGRQLLYVIRTGVKVYVEPDQLVGDGGISKMEQALHTKVASDTIGPVATSDVVITFQNSGGRHLMTRGSVEFHAMDNSTAAIVQIPEFPTLPGAPRIVRVPVPSNLRAGQYTALAVMDFGGPEVVAGHLPVIVK